MNKEEISTFLGLFFTDRKLFTNLIGADKLFDKNFMLIYDALQEEVNLMTDILDENLSKNSIALYEVDKKLSIKNRNRF
jgi:hypothetical protein